MKTTEEIIAGNRLLAEFMGTNEANASIDFVYDRYEPFPYSGLDFSDEEVIEEVRREIDGIGSGLNIQVKNFHDDWGLLMPVVEKIEGLDGGEWFRVNVYEKACEIYHITGEYIPVLIKAESKIEAVWSACVEFAEWYKNQPK